MNHLGELCTFYKLYVGMQEMASMFWMSLYNALNMWTTDLFSFSVKKLKTT